MERLKQRGPQGPEQRPGPNSKICIWCSHKGDEACITECQKGGRYHHLDPEQLEQWEPGPRLPPFREMLQMTASERLAILWLVTFYQGQGR